MKVTKWLVFGVFCALLCGCGKQVKNEGIPVVELSKAVGEIDLKLSDLLENIRVIPLETRPDVLLPGHFLTWVGEKYIVTLGDDAMHLFTVDGKYVRKLAQEGRGPDEYFGAISFCVDKQERYGYIASGVGSICVIDLEKGGVVRKISTGKYAPTTLWYSDKDSTLVYALFDMGRMDGDICRTALDGTLLHTVESSSKSGPLQYFCCMNDTIRYKMSFCDTLFLLADTVKIPYCRLVAERPFSMALESGKVISILFENKDRLILCCDEVRMQ
ncbi:MAG: 6-bladed beta-propeller, partial [Odoribacter sp.]|nr:6-bladed beta-propeller [Odoribacter sp.]